MLKRKYIYNFVIILIYIICCVFIYQDTKENERKNNYKDNSNNINNKSYTLIENKNSDEVQNTDKKSIVKISSYNKQNNDVIATIEIPKLKLKQNIYQISNSQKDVDKHVVILKKSTFPVEKESILFIAAHSGSGSKAYFNEINKLSTDDEIKFYYKKHLYTYFVDKVFQEDKDGNIEISKTHKHELILTTCSTTNKNKQLIVKSIIKE